MPRIRHIGRLTSAFPLCFSLLALLAVSCQKGPATTVQLQIEGMDCEGCAKTARKTLESIGGVRSASVSFEKKVAEVVCDPAKVTPQALVTALENIVVDGNKLPFRASVLSGPAQAKEGRP